MTRDKAIAELVRIWHSPHLDLSLKAGLAEAIDALKENNQSDSLVRDEVDDCKESESKLDLISRQAAIECCQCLHPEDCWAEINALPSAEPKTGEWIPVSEKPKDEERTYLVQLDSGGMRSCRWTNANPIWTDLTIDWHWNIFDIPQYCKVVAWMDLKPYKGGEDE